MIKNIAKQIVNIKKELNELSRLIISNNGKSDYFFLDEEEGGEQTSLFTNNINKIANSVNTLEFNDELESNETKHFYGVAAISQDIADKISHVNELKTTFKKDYSSLNFRKNPSKRRELIELIDIKRLNARQLYRKIHIIKIKTELISFSICHTRSIKPISWIEAYEKINALESSANTDQDIKYLNSNDKQIFAVVQKNPPHMRINYQDEHKNKYQIKSSLPIFVLSEDNTLPTISKPFECGYKEHTRKNQYLSNDIVLNSIKAFRYTKERDPKWVRN